MSEQNLIGIGRDLIDTFNAKDSERFKKQLSNAVVYDEVGTQRKFQSADAWMQVWEQWRKAFPDLKGNDHECGCLREHCLCKRSPGRERTMALSRYRMAEFPRQESARIDFARARLRGRQSEGGPDLLRHVEPASGDRCDS
jgi:hypothetical protein